jgi:hypothetical protein
VLSATWTQYEDNVLELDAAGLDATTRIQIVEKNQVGLVGNALKSSCYYDGSTAFTVTTPDDESTFTDVGAEFIVHNNNLYIYDVDVLAVQASTDAEF